MNFFKRLRKKLHPYRAAYVAAHDALHPRPPDTDLKERAQDGYLDIEECGVRFKIKASGGVAFFAAIGRFEPIETDLISSLITPQTVFVDAGANVGYFSILASLLGAKVYAFEPTRTTFETLKSNLTANNIETVTAENSALMDRSGKFKLTLNGSYFDGHNTLGQPTQDNESIIGSEMIDAITLDEYVDKNGINRIDIIKIDVEGAELPLLEGAQKTLASTKPLIVFETSDEPNSFGNTYADTSGFLESLGYELSRRPDNRRTAVARFSP